MNLIFLGPPGAGKGTMAARAAAEAKIPHISTGDLFRNAIKNETDLGKKVKAILAKGDLVPDDLTIALVAERLSATDTNPGYILDGFPRTIPQAESFEAMSKIDKVINFVLADDAIVERLSGRRTCKSCGRGYHLKFMPPKREGVCDVCGGELYTRPDDSEESIRNRLTVYAKQTQPLIAFYSKRKILADIDAGPGPDTVFRSIQSLL
jgi:adenylate kinase